MTHDREWLERAKNTPTYREVNGIVFVGDQHVSSLKPGRRKDKDYRKTVLDKIDWVITHCNENRYVPAFLGDLFDNAVERDEALKTRLLRILRKCWTQPVANVGNHDKSNRYLTDGDSLAYIAEAGAMRLAMLSGVLDVFVIGGKKIGLGATPYDQDIPTDARLFFPDVDSIVWMTHHDLAFDGAYPGAKELAWIRGCKLAINGHMHIKKPIRKVQDTNWYNPGAIIRQAVDAMEHIPAVTVIGMNGRMHTVEVPHERDVFDLTGKLIDSISPGEAGKAAADEQEDSAFVALLSANSSMEMARSDDGSILKEDIFAKFDRQKTPSAVRDIVLAVHKRAVETVGAAS